VFRVFVLGAAYSQLSAQSSTSSPDLIKDFEELRFATIAADLLNLLVGVAVVIVWSFWFQRTRLNAESFAPGRIRHASGLAAGSWFIPVVNLYMPKQISNDIWTATTGQSTGAKRWLLHTWWWFWLVYLVTYLNDSISSWYENDFAVGATDIIVTSQVAHFVGIATAVLAIFFVTRLTSLQQTRVRGGA
jgi:hypothetical protein